MARSLKRWRMFADRAPVAWVTIADRPMSRMVGLLGRSSLIADEGLVISPCRAIHTWFMRFPIDVLFLDRDGTVVRAVESVGPWRMQSGGRAAHVTVELAAGTLRRVGIGPGTRVWMEPA